MSRMKPKLARIPNDSHTGIRYRLYRIHSADQSRYQMIVWYLQDRAECVFRADSDDHAREIYRKIVNGRVTPCTLNDVIEDLTS